MIVALLSKPELSILNKKAFNYKLADAEKDYMLAVVCGIIYSSKLKNKLIFKGGTAIHHCYVSQSRLSEDLDFTSLDKNIGMNEVKAVFQRHDFLEVKDDRTSPATLKIDRLKYTGPLGQPNSLKIEIDFTQNVVLPAQLKPYSNSWKLKSKVNVMDVREICAEKVRAASGRARYRDFYDLALLFAAHKFDLSEIKSLIKRKEIRKPITQASIAENWNMAKKERQHEIGRIYYAQEVQDAEIEKLIKRLNINIS